MQSHSVQFTVKFRASTDVSGLAVTGDGKVLTGSSRMLDREAGFYAVRWKTDESFLGDATIVRLELVGSQVAGRRSGRLRHRWDQEARFSEVGASVDAPAARGQQGRLGRRARPQHRAPARPVQRCHQAGRGAKPEMAARRNRPRSRCRRVVRHSRLLTAGCFDDVGRLDVFRKFASNGQALRSAISRVAFSAVSWSSPSRAPREPIAGARVTVGANGGETVSFQPHRWRAIFVVSYDRLASDADLTVTVTAERRRSRRPFRKANAPR
jgi:hypothetical protein